MLAAIDPIGPWLLDALIAAAAWLSLAMIATISCRQPIFRRDLARMGLAGSLVLVPLSLLPGERLGLLGGVPEVLRTSGTLTPWGESFRGLASVLVFGYLAVVLLGIGWMVLGAWALRRLTGTARGASDRAQALHDRLPFSGPAARRPRLLVSRRINRPALIGWRGPAIVIPEGWDDPGPAEEPRLRLGLLHELAHAEQGDPLFQWLGGIARVLWFPLPPAWWLRHQLRSDQELLADARVVRLLDAGGPDYAATLVRLAAGRESWRDRERSSGEGQGGAIPRTDGSFLVRRVAVLVGCPFPIAARTPTWWRLGMPLASAVVLLLASRLTVADGPSMGHRAGSEPIRFRLQSLSIEPTSKATTASLPAPLPEAFELTLELRTGPGGIDEVAVAGCRLAEPPEAPGSEGNQWRQARLVVDDRGARLQIDGQDAPAHLEADDDPEWLTIRAGPGCALEIRGLDLRPLGPGEAQARGGSGVTGNDRAAKGLSERGPRPSRRRGPS